MCIVVEYRQDIVDSATVLQCRTTLDTCCALAGYQSSQRSTCTLVSAGASTCPLPNYGGTVSGRADVSVRLGRSPGSSLLPATELEVQLHCRETPQMRVRDVCGGFCHQGLGLVLWPSHSGRKFLLTFANPMGSQLPACSTPAVTLRAAGFTSKRGTTFSYLESQRQHGYFRACRMTVSEQRTLLAASCGSAVALKSYYGRSYWAPWIFSSEYYL